MKRGKESSHDSATSLLANGTGEVHPVLPQGIQLGPPHPLGVTDQDLRGPQGTCQMQVGLLVGVALGRFDRPQRWHLASSPQEFKSVAEATQEGKTWQQPVAVKVTEL